METKDWLTLVGILATLAVALINLWYNVIASKRTTFVNAVTTSRIKWIETVRERIASFAGLTYHWPITKLSDEESQRLIKECDVLRVLIELCFNPTDVHDQHIITLLKEIPKLTRPEQHEELRAAIDDLVHATQLRLKTEWQKVKREARGDEFDEAAWLRDVAQRAKRSDASGRGRKAAV
jgi:hypothetical protein